MSHLRKTISDSAHPFPCRVVIVAGTYDGVLIGWDTDEQVEERADVKGDDEVQVCLKMSFATCSEPGCNCDFFRVELLARADLSQGGSCYKCKHDIASHSRRPAGKCPILI
jgi:hypothetical protein